MQLSNTLKQYLIVKQALVPALVNLVLNGLISWLVLRNVASITLWGKPSIALDLLLTAFLIPFITCFINSYTIAKSVRSGKVEKLDAPLRYFTLWHLTPIYARSFLLGLIALVCVGVPTVLLLETLWVEPISLWQFVIFKALWAGTLAAVVTPIIGLWAIANTSHKTNT
jgi:hypothetical protein